MKTRIITDKTAPIIPLIIYLFYLAMLTLNPFNFSISWMEKWARLSSSDLFYLLLLFRLDDFLLNILLFLPFGLIIGRIYTSKGIPFRKIIVNTTLLGLALSFMIETSQLFLERSTSLFDLVSNTGGAALGVLVLRRSAGSRPVLQQVSGWLLSFILFVYLIIILIPSQMNHTHTWNDNFQLIIGDEANGGRPWKGNIFMAAIYRRSLSPSEARKLFSFGTDSLKLDPRIRMGALSCWDFTLPSTSTYPDLVDRNTGLSLHSMGEEKQGTSPRLPLKSSRPATNVVTAARMSGQMSLETWLQTASLDQSGPGRIITFSANQDERNFTLGQEGRKVVFRVRTPLTGPNGSRICLISRPLLSQKAPQHLVVTFNRGIMRLYIDGRSSGDAVYALADYLPLAAHYDTSGVVRFLFLFGLLLPLPLLAMTIPRKPHFAAALLYSLTPVIFGQLYYCLVLGQPLDWFYLLASLSAVIVGFAAGRIIRSKREE